MLYIRATLVLQILCHFHILRFTCMIYVCLKTLLGNKAPPLGWGSIGWLYQSNGSAWHSSPVRIYSYAASGPPCGLLEPKDVDSIGPLPCRTRLGPRHGAEGFFIRKMRPFKESHTFASHKYAVVEHPYGVLNTKPRPLGGDSLTFCRNC